MRCTIFSYSAGAGRSGTYMAFDNLFNEMKETKKIDPMKAVLKMRENRKDMVQNEVRLINVKKRTNKTFSTFCFRTVQA